MRDSLATDSGCWRANHKTESTRLPFHVYRTIFSATTTSREPFTPPAFPAEGHKTTHAPAPNYSQKNELLTSAKGREAMYARAPG